MGGTRAWALVCAVMLAGCPQGDGKILGDIPGLGPACYIPCQSRADCPAPLDISPSYHWECADERCIAVDCLTDADCAVGTHFLGGTQCIDYACTEPCDTDFDCGGGYVCQDGACASFPLPPNLPRCDADADCARHAECSDGFDCYCSRDGACRQYFGTSPRCSIAADCVDGGHGVLFDVDNWECVERNCVWLGCQSTSECDAMSAGSTCDPTTRFCTSTCIIDDDCRDFDDPFYTYAATPPGEPFVVVCNAGACEFDDTCETDADCSRSRNGHCWRGSGPELGNCSYPEWPVCFDDGDCEVWEYCLGNGCQPLTFRESDPAASGRPCAGDADCRALQLSQAIAHYAYEGDALVYLQCHHCDTDVDCPGDLVCEDLTGGTVYDYLLGDRSVCLPRPCTSAGGCAASLSTCHADADCPAGETCAFSVTGCPGACLAFACAACADWLDQNTLHACMPPSGDARTQIVRPD